MDSELTTTVSELPVEEHPLEPFLPTGARVLMLGSFPPKKQRWGMDFYYPNFINDMWRVMGLVFYGDKDRFIAPEGKRFDRQRIIDFCMDKGIALSDTARSVRRLKDNASDKFLEVVECRDVAGLLEELPACRAVVTTGQKATDTLLSIFPGTEQPAVGCRTRLNKEGRELYFYRMPSTSRAYPKSLAAKAEDYRKMFAELGLL